jgi:hypothetical protein
MLIQKIQKITYIHGWLFGPYIWNDVIKYFRQPALHTKIVLSGYDEKSNFSNVIKIDNVLSTAKKGDMIIAYSYSASLILNSSKLSSCQAIVILINPFFEPKTYTIDSLYIDIKNNSKEAFRKFMFNCTKGVNNNKSDFIKLTNLFNNNFIPSIENLCLGLDDLKKIYKEDKDISYTKNIHIIQSSDDQINSLDTFNQLKKNKISTYILENSPHYPFFEFKKIYDIIKKIL